MSTADWIAIAIVAACAAWALRGAWRWWRGRGACGCSHCPAVRQHQAPPAKAPR